MVWLARGQDYPQVDSPSKALFSPTTLQGIEAEGHVMGLPVAAARGEPLLALEAEC